MPNGEDKYGYVEEGSPAYRPHEYAERSFEGKCWCGKEAYSNFHRVGEDVLNAQWVPSRPAYPSALKQCAAIGHVWAPGYGRWTGNDICEVCNLVAPKPHEAPIAARSIPLFPIEQKKRTVEVGFWKFVAMASLSGLAAVYCLTDLIWGWS